MATHRNQQRQQRMYDVVCEKCDDIGELLNLSVLTGLQGNNHFEGHLILFEHGNARYFWLQGWLNLKSRAKHNSSLLEYKNNCQMAMTFSYHSRFNYRKRA